MRVFGSSRSVMSSHDLLNLYVHLRDKSHFILPPPPIYPPLPPTFLSPSILKLQRLFGGDSATIAKDRPIPLVLLRLDLSTPEEISASIQKSDVGRIRVHQMGDFNPQPLHRHEPFDRSKTWSNQIQRFD
eukprot:Gregarina_sp_Poly_1__498@NODE_111_length_13906_cov_58_362887_g98_i0_p11_GENE_NODE_111_length_13906_cov_58_362887_g98_i0NODE_111_length_13906_cov_58_362887_g98_i0_p11_ORF_typecomplete_len130_score14_76_NODE_111_length_13906_cov_58_362887_g98_i026953084